jgi:hypothetical protein
MGENLSAYTVVYETGKPKWNTMQEGTLLRFPPSPVRMEEKSRLRLYLGIAITRQFYHK